LGHVVELAEHLDEPPDRSAGFGAHDDSLGAWSRLVNNSCSNNY
jgi:hypothetical protein